MVSSHKFWGIIFDRTLTWKAWLQLDSTCTSSRDATNIPIIGLICHLVEYSVFSFYFFQTACSLHACALERPQGKKAAMYNITIICWSLVSSHYFQQLSVLLNLLCLIKLDPIYYYFLWDYSINMLMTIQTIGST